MLLPVRFFMKMVAVNSKRVEAYPNIKGITWIAHKMIVSLHSDFLCSQSNKTSLTRFFSLDLTYVLSCIMDSLLKVVFILEKYNLTHLCL